jgi:hypothetical protein
MMIRMRPSSPQRRELYILREMMYFYREVLLFFDLNPDIHMPNAMPNERQKSLLQGLVKIQE